MSLYENIKKTISSVFAFHEKPSVETKSKDNDILTFQNRNKVSKIADIFHDIKSDESLEETDKNPFDFIVIASFLDNLPNIAGFF